MGGGGDNRPGQYMGWWGSLDTILFASAIREHRLITIRTGSPPQKGIITYSLSPNRQRPLAGTVNAAIFNSWRRFRGQVLFWAPTFVAGYFLMDWAVKRNKYLNSKEGRHELEGL